MKIRFSRKRDVKRAKTSPLFEIARVLVPFDYVARVVINASDGPMWGNAYGS
jgi:predicted trehalose synthase